MIVHTGPECPGQNPMFWNAAMIIAQQKWLAGKGMSACRLLEFPLRTPDGCYVGQTDDALSPARKGRPRSTQPQGLTIARR